MPSAPIPGPTTEAQAQVNGLLQADAAKNRVAVHTFDPDASPAEKAAAAGKGREQLKKVGTGNGAAGEGVAGASNVIPTITISEAENFDPEKPNELHVSPPGGLPAGPAPAIPDWFLIGWRAVSGIDEVAPDSEDAKQKSLLQTYVSEQYYGDWYHNAALVFFAVFTSHFLTRFGFGWGWLFILLAFCNTYYTTSMERVRRRARDDIQRELVKTRLASEHESADWINHFLDRFWLIYEPVLSATVVASVDQVLSASTPAFLDSLRLTTFTLGTKAPRIDRVRTFPRTADDIIMMDWAISFTPNDISDLTPRQLQTKVNPKIVLSVRVGKGVTATVPILLEDITFSGHLRIRMKLMTNFPHVQIVDISFLEKPVVDFVLKPLGGDTFGMDIAHIPGLSSFIRDTLHSVLGPMMYEPNVFQLNLEQMLSGAPLDTAVGVLQVHIICARSLKANKMGGGSPDPFVSLSINGRQELAKTKYKHDTHNPSWHETKFILVNNLTESLTLDLWDYNDHRKNTALGQTSFDLNRLLEDATQEGLEEPVLIDGKERGTLRYDVSFYPVIKPEVAAEGEAELLNETNVGIVRLVVHQGKDLDQSKTTLGDLNPFAKVYLGDSPTPTLTTQRFKHTVNPVWEAPVEFLCSDRKNSVITVKVIDDRDFLKDPMVGYMSLRLNDLLDSRKEAGRDWWPLSGCKTGRLRLSAEWKPLDMAGSLHGADTFTPPIGVVRLWLKKATDVKNVEAALGGKSDPYVLVHVKSQTRGRTDVINNNLNPEWDQIIYIPVHSMRENLMLKLMDYQHLTKDRGLGYVEVRLRDLIQESDDPKYPYAPLGKKEAADPIKLDNGSFKGKLHYVVEFVPALALNGVRFDTGPNEVQRAAQGADGDDDGDVVESDGSSMSSSDVELERVPVGVTVSKPMGAPAANGGHHKSDSVATTKTTNTTKTAASGSDEPETKTAAAVEAEQGVTLSREELLSNESGILICNVHGGQLQKKARLEVCFDDGYWPAFSTITPRSTRASWDQIGEGFIKELDFGRVWLRLNEAEEGYRDDIIAEWKGDAKDFINKSLDGPATFTLTSSDGDKTSTVQIETRFVPVPIKLEARESISNQGMLRVDLLDGRDIHAADRGGKSDPFAVFSLNGSKVYKSQTKKKTLNPEWNENFVVGVPSRVAAEFELVLFDWNQIEQAKELGSSLINLADLEPFQASERVISLSHAKIGEKGEIRVRLLFTPEIIARSRQKTSTFSTAGRVMTGIGGIPVGGAKGVGRGLGKVFTMNHSKGESVDSSMDSPSPPAGQASHPVVASKDYGTIASNGPSFPSTLSVGSEGPNDVGTLRVTIIDAKDLQDEDGDAVKAYVQLRVGDKEQKTKNGGKSHTPDWNEGFSFAAGPLTPKVFLWVFEHKTFGKDKMLGEGEIDIWRHIQTRGQTNAEVTIELRSGTGQLRALLEFDADVSPTPSNKRSTEQTVSPSRFSISRRKVTMTQDGASD